MAQNQVQSPKIYAYTQHVNTVKIIESVCGVNITVLNQDRTRDPVDDILSQLQLDTAQQIILYAVLPIDKALELKQRAPSLTLRLTQLDGSVIERLTGKPYDPKAEYPPEIVKPALKIIEVKGGTIRYMSFRDMIFEIVKRGFKRISVFNDTLRQGIKLAMDKLGCGELELVKTCDSNDCVEVNPLGYKSGYRISFPGTAGRLTPEQMAEMILRNEARIYYAEVIAEEVPICA